MGLFAVFLDPRTKNGPGLGPLDCNAILNGLKEYAVAREIQHILPSDNQECSEN
jgi:hypothetical protein